MNADKLIVGGKRSGKSFELGKQAGRDEVISEIEKFLASPRTNFTSIRLYDIQKKLTQLKEQK